MDKKYQILTHSLVVLPKGEPLFSECATYVRMEDEAAGPFVVMTQHPDSGTQELRFDLDEWDSIKSAVDSLVGEYQGKYDTTR